jgi:murein DD-endopeptidase MepM/ murein hydrolase activator NlpD
MVAHPEGTLPPARPVVPPAGDTLVAGGTEEHGTDGPAAPGVAPAPVVAPAPGGRPSPVLRPAGGARRLIIPVQGVAPGDLVDTFEAARSQGREHNAIDILAPRGTPVLAAVDGRIVRLFYSEKGGKTIYQLGPDHRTVYYYAHLDRYADSLRAGLPVRQGTVIGYVGDTGNAVPGNHHLHFAIWTIEDTTQFWDGVNVNPYPLLRGLGRGDARGRGDP